MTTRARRLGYAAGWALGLGAMLWFFFGSVGAPDEADLIANTAMTETDTIAPLAPDGAPDGSTQIPNAPADLAPSPLFPSGEGPDVTTGGSRSGARYVSYAVGLHELQGLAPDTPPGTRLELWAAWDPPLVEEARVQRLVEEILLEKVIPPVLPEGPYVAVLSLRPRDVPSLLYADLWGRLSVVMLDPQP